jgi:hypothetical protein
MPATELALMHRRRYRDAVLALEHPARLMGRRNDFYRCVVEFVVLQEIGIEAIASDVSGYRDRGGAR